MPFFSGSLGFENIDMKTFASWGAYEHLRKKRLFWRHLY
jgi:hypothetical protein